MTKDEIIEAANEIADSLEGPMDDLAEACLEPYSLTDVSTAAELKAQVEATKATIATSFLMLEAVIEKNLGRELARARTQPLPIKEVPVVGPRDAAMACQSDLERVILALGERGVAGTLSDLKKVRNAATYAPELACIPSTISTDDLVVKIGTAHQRVMATLINPVKVAS